MSPRVLTASWSPGSTNGSAAEDVGPCSRAMSWSRSTSSRCIPRRSSGQIKRGGAIAEKDCVTAAEPPWRHAICRHEPRRQSGISSDNGHRLPLLPAHGKARVEPHSSIRQHLSDAGTRVLFARSCPAAAAVRAPRGVPVRFGCGPRRAAADRSPLAVRCGSLGCRDRARHRKLRERRRYRHRPARATPGL